MLCPLCDAEKSMLLITTQTQMQEGIFEAYDFHRCENCQCIYLKKPPTAKAMEHFYNAGYLPYLGAKSWGKYEKIAQWGQKRIDDRRIDFVYSVVKKIDKNTKILDFGCGFPTFLQRLKDKKSLVGTGYDLFIHGQQRMNSQMKHSDVTKDKTEIHLISGDFYTKKFDHFWDVITLWHVLEHEFEPKKLLKKLFEVTKPGGILIVEVPNYQSWTRKWQGQHWAGYHTPRHAVIYTPQTLKKVFDENGWRVKKMVMHGSLDSYTLWWLGHLEKKRQKNKNVKFSLEKMFRNFLFFKVLFLLVFMWEKVFSFGVMRVVCEKPNEPTPLV